MPDCNCDWACPPLSQDTARGAGAATAKKREVRESPSSSSLSPSLPFLLFLPLSAPNGRSRRDGRIEFPNRVPPWETPLRGTRRPFAGARKGSRESCTVIPPTHLDVSHQGRRRKGEIRTLASIARNPHQCSKYDWLPSSRKPTYLRFRPTRSFTSLVEHKDGSTPSPPPPPSACVWPPSLDRRCRLALARHAERQARDSRERATASSSRPPSPPPPPTTTTTEGRNTSQAAQRARGAD